MLCLRIYDVNDARKAFFVRGWMLFGHTGMWSPKGIALKSTGGPGSTYTSARRRNAVLAAQLKQFPNITRANVLDGSLGYTGLALMDVRPDLHVNQLNYNTNTLLALASLGFKHLYHTTSMLNDVKPALKGNRRRDAWMVMYQALKHSDGGVLPAALGLVGDIPKTVFAMDTFGIWCPHQQDCLKLLCSAKMPLALITWCTRNCRLSPIVPTTHKIIFKSGRCTMKWIIIVLRRSNKTKRAKKAKTKNEKPKKYGKPGSSVVRKTSKHKQSLQIEYTRRFIGRVLLVPGRFWTQVDEGEDVNALFRCTIVGCDARPDFKPPIGYRIQCKGRVYNHMRHTSVLRYIVPFGKIRK